MSDFNDRIIQLAKHYGVNKPSEFAKRTGFSHQVASNYLKSAKKPSVDALQKIQLCFENINPNWLLTGKGKMLLSQTPQKPSDYIHFLEKEDLPKGAVPYYNLLVSAGKSLFEIEGAKKYDGYVLGLPGIGYAEAILPVRGFSMQPEIKEGAIIGVRRIEKWDTLNTQYKYLIITHEDRIVKYIEHDLKNDHILWCISPNYPKFKIYKEDIIEIHRVTFVMNPE